jgi:hypothetical protein
MSLAENFSLYKILFLYPFCEISERAFNPRPQHHAIFYPPHAHLIEYPKRNFDEIDRLSDFDKRNFDEIDRMGSLIDFKKRNFDEIDRMGSLTDF